MFFGFTKNLFHNTSDLRIIWRAEVILTSTLRAYTESPPSNLDHFKIQAEEALKQGNSSDPLFENYFQELHFLIENNKEKLINFLSDLEKADATFIKSNLNPLRESLLSAIQNDAGFNEFISKK